MVRLASGIVLAAAAIAAVRFLPLEGLQLVAVLVAAITAHEYLGIVGTKGLVRQMVPITVTMVVCLAVGRQYLLFATEAMVAALAWVAVDVLATGRRLEQSAADLFAPIYVGAPLGLLVSIHAFGWQVTVLLVGLVIVSDSAQYYVGRTLGRHPLAPAISPKKTIEGAVGGVVAGVAFMMIFAPIALGSSVHPLSMGRLVSMGATGAVVVALGICGDLFESRLKRLAGVKDSSALIPGHGGALDRLDALLFATPAFYFYLQYSVSGI